MIALQAHRAARRILAAPCSAGWTGALNVLVDEDAVVEHALEAGAGNPLPGGIELWRAEGHLQRLPFPRRARGVGPGRMAIIGTLRLRDPAVVDAPTRGVAQLALRRADRVQYLNLVVSHQVDPGVRLLRHAELEVHLAAPMLHRGMEVHRASRRAIHHGSDPGRDLKPPAVVRVKVHTPGDLPGVLALRRPSGQIPATVEVDPVAHEAFPFAFHSAP